MRQVPAFAAAAAMLLGSTGALAAAASPQPAGALETARLQPPTVAAALPTRAKPVRHDPQAMAPEALVGLDEDAVEALLGRPASRSETSPAKAWHYRFDDCALVLRFYMDLDLQVFRTLAYEVISHDTTVEGDRHCLAGIQPARTVVR